MADQTDDVIPLLPEDDAELKELLAEEAPAVAAPVSIPEPIVMPELVIPEPVVVAPVSVPAPEVVAPSVSMPTIIAPSSPVGEVMTDPAQHIQNIQMANLLTSAIEEGKHKVPEDPTPLVSKPTQLEPWRVFKIMAEFVDGFDLISKYSKAVTFFGSEREVFASRFYDDATALAGLLAKRGFAVITGGSDGIMEAANKGAFEAGGASIGLNIRLADDQKTNKYVTSSMMFEHFFVRKVMLTFASEAYIYFPGGFGTLDEFTEILTLVQTKNIKPVPIVLYGKEYWAPLLELFKNDLDEKYHAINHEDLELYHVVDTVEEACEYVCANAKTR